MNGILCFAAALALPPALSMRQELAREPALVKVERVRDAPGTPDERWTVRARDSSPRALLERLAEISGRALEADAALDRAGPVTVSLDGRSLEQVLEYALGAVGLQAELSRDAISVRDDTAEADTPGQRAALAEAAWQRAAARFPRHAGATSAALARGELAELRGRSESARGRYLELLERDPRSPPAAEAYLRAGRIAAERREWGEASEHFRALANLAGAEEYQAVARVELARATLALQDAPSALHILEALERSHPTRERTEVTARTLIRVEALLAAARFQDALFELESRGPQLDALGARAAPELRARALEGAGLLDEAARAWLLVARGADQGRPRALAFEKAARLALDAQDELAVLFIAREAQACGVGATVAACEREARSRLGAAGPQPADVPSSARERLAQAELVLERSHPERAAELFEELFTARSALALEPEERARVALGWARCLCASSGVDTALELLSDERARLEAGTARALLDRGTAALLEERGLFERAADAYQGEY